MNAWNSDVAQQLSKQSAGLTMNSPVDAILTRGAALNRRRRQRRRAATLGSVAFCGAVTALAASAIAPPGNSSLVTSAQAAWGSSLVNVSSELLAEATKQCAGPAGDMRSKLSLSSPVGADSRNGETIVVFRDQDNYAICNYMGDAPDNLEIAGVTTDAWAQLPAGASLKFISGTFAQPTPSDPVTDGAGVLRVADDVARVTIAFDGEVWETAVAGGFAMFWMPDGISDMAWEEAAVTAYDADDHRVSTQKMRELL